SKNFLELIKQITDAYQLRIELSEKLRMSKLKFYPFTQLHFASCILIFGFVFKKIAKLNISQKRLVIDSETQMNDSFVKVSFADKSQLEKSWLNCVDTFEEVMKSEKIWDLTYSENVNTV